MKNRGGWCCKADFSGLILLIGLGAFFCTYGADAQSSKHPAKGNADWAYIGGSPGEFLVLEYQDGDRIYVPVQSLHLVSAISFLCAYVLVFTDPAAAALVGWLVAMPCCMKP